MCKKRICGSLVAFIVAFLMITMAVFANTQPAYAEELPILLAKATAVNKSSAVLKWKKNKKADKYAVYFTSCDGKKILVKENKKDTVSKKKNTFK